ncbi:MAG TPA: hypothetical protein VKE70_12225 [Candidatus Solibacter sp.]|nr:hypothetical protein [Candidatus Solibacter sp.]
MTISATPDGLANVTSLCVAAPARTQLPRNGVDQGAFCADAMAVSARKEIERTSTMSPSLSPIAKQRNEHRSLTVAAP